MSYPTQVSFKDVELTFLHDVVVKKTISKATNEATVSIFHAICQQYNLQLNLSPRLAHQVRLKLGRFLVHLRQSKKGGRQLEKFKRWISANSIWKFKILQTEFTEQLPGKDEPRTPKVRTLAQKHKETVVQQIINKYRRSPCHPFPSYSRSHRYRLKASLAEDCANSLEFLKFCGLEAEKVTVRNIENGALQ